MARRQAIIDVGSNSVRLVVYSGTPRIPNPIFNEKVMAGLGKSVGETGDLSPDSMDRALAAIRRFRVLTREMKVDETRLVATAAVRDASNGRAFVKSVEKIGFKCEVLSGEEEAVLAGEGVLSGIRNAEGIVADLGGGSLDLVTIGNGRAGAAMSLPLGVLRLAASSLTEQALSEQLRQALRGTETGEGGRGKCLYLVGGSWRALARMDMAATRYPLPVTHEYSMAPSHAGELRTLVSAPDARWSKGIAEQRVAAAPDAAALLCALVAALRPGRLILSTFGIREGLLFAQLDRRTRAQDPLIEAARDAGDAERRFGPHGDLLDDWIDGIFNDAPEMKRLRLASCLLADVAWQASAPFRAERAVEMALHGNWVGIDPPGRVILAQALSSSFGSNKHVGDTLAQLCSAEDLKRARLWGLAIRLGQRFSAGAAAALEGSRLSRGRGSIELRVSKSRQALVAEPVLRRLDQLASAMETEGRIAVY